MSTTYFFMKDVDTSHLGKTILPDVYCPTGGYDDKNMGRRFDSKGEKFRYLRAHGMREAEVVNPEKGIGGTEGASIKKRGPRGNFRARQMPGWMRKELANVSGVE